jgi:hypothetical protein
MLTFGLLQVCVLGVTKPWCVFEYMFHICEHVILMSLVLLQLEMQFVNMT